MHRVVASNSHTPPGEVSQLSPGPELCEICFSDLVQPVDAEASRSGSVRLTLRCPECHHIRVGECSWEEARAFGRHFAAGRRELRATHQELRDELFRNEIACFALALQTDLLGPDDFAPRRYSA